MILVFKKGTSHTFHGVDCEFKRINPGQLREYEKNGWTTDHRDLAPKNNEQKDQHKQQKYKPSNKG